LSHATIVGFMGGAATVVCLQQLKGMLGLHHFTTATDVVSIMRSLFSQTHQVQYSTEPFHCLLHHAPPLLVATASGQTAQSRVHAWTILQLQRLWPHACARHAVPQLPLEQASKAGQPAALGSRTLRACPAKLSAGEDDRDMNDRGLLSICFLANQFLLL
jgi:hypothetical protein